VSQTQAAKRAVCTCQAYFWSISLPLRRKMLRSHPCKSPLCHSHRKTSMSCKARKF